MGNWGWVLSVFSLFSSVAFAAPDPLKEKYLADVVQDRTLARSERVRAAGKLAELTGMNGGYEVIIADTLFSAMRDSSVALRIETIEVTKSAVIKLGSRAGDLLILFKRALCNDRDERVRAYSIDAIREVVLAHQADLYQKLFRNLQSTKNSRKLVADLAELLSRAARNDSSPSLRQKAQVVELELAKLVEFAVSCDMQLN